MEELDIKTAIQIAKILAAAPDERIPMILDVFSKAQVDINGLDELAEWRALDKQTALIDTDAFVTELTKGKEAVPKLAVEDGVEKVVMGENNQPVWDKERALITTKGGNYRRIVTLTYELAAEVAKGHRYFNAVEKNGKLHITGRVSARF